MSIPFKSPLNSAAVLKPALKLSAAVLLAFILLLLIISFFFHNLGATVYWPGNSGFQ